MGPSVSAPLIESRYVGATTAIHAELGPEAARASVSGEVFGGIQLGRWISTEGFFAYRSSEAFHEDESGEPCRSAPIDQWSWRAFGTRLWIHLFRLPFMSVSIAPMIAFGLARGRREGIMNQRVPSCAFPTRFVTGWSMDAAVDFSVELRPTSWLGVRTNLTTGIAGAHASSLSFEALSIGWSLGPVFRF